MPWSRIHSPRGGPLHTDMQEHSVKLALLLICAGTSDDEELRSTHSESNAVELARLLYWLMVVGYSLRALEVRFDMESSMDLPPGDAFPSLPPGY